MFHVKHSIFLILILLCGCRVSEPPRPNGIPENAILRSQSGDWERGRKFIWQDNVSRETFFYILIQDYCERGNNAFAFPRWGLGRRVKCFYILNPLSAEGLGKEGVKTTLLGGDSRFRGNDNFSRSDPDKGRRDKFCFARNDNYII